MGTRASGDLAIRKGYFNTFLWQSFSDGYRIFQLSSAVPATAAIFLDFLARRTGGKYEGKYLSSSYGRGNATEVVETGRLAGKSRENSRLQIFECSMESTVPRKNLLLIVGFAGAGLLVLIVLMFTGSVFKPWRSEPSNSWNREAIQATYVASQLRQIDKAHSTLVLSYDLENNTDLDYRVADGPGVVILSRLKSDGSLSQEQPIRLGYPVFLPAKQRARIAVEITQPLAWPVQDDPAYEDKLRDFV